MEQRQGQEGQERAVAPGTCATCPAWVRAPRESFGACRLGPPFGASAECGWPLTGHDDWCASHPERRHAFRRAVPWEGGSAESGRKGSIAHGRETACRFVMPDPASIAPLESRNAPKRPLPGASPEADDLARLARAARLTPDPEEAIAHLTDHARRLALDLARQRRITTDARDERDAALRLAAILFRALAKVERVISVGPSPASPATAYCPWCGATTGRPCQEHCARRQALAAYHGTPTTDGPPPPPPGTPIASDRNLIGRAEGDPSLPSGVSASRAGGETTSRGAVASLAELTGTEKSPADGDVAFSGGKTAMPEKPKSPSAALETGFLDGKNAGEVNQVEDGVFWPGETVAVLTGWGGDAAVPWADGGGDGVVAPGGGAGGLSGLCREPAKESLERGCLSENHRCDERSVGWAWRRRRVVKRRS